MLFDIFGGTEQRNLENPTCSLSDPANWFNMSVRTAGDVEVSEESALSVPAIWQAVNLISSTIANLPLHLYKTDKDGQPIKATNDALYRVVHDRANAIHTKSAFFKWWVWRALAGTKGRGIALLTRNAAGRVAGFLPLDESTVTIRQSVEAGKLVRTYTYGTTIYQAWDVIDLAPVLARNGLDALSPVVLHRNTIAAMIEAEAYATALFQNGGVPPLTLTGPQSSPAAADRASEQISASLRTGRNRKRQILPLPTGFELNNIGFDPAAQQMIELRRFHVSEASRIYNVAPAMLHDLSTGTYANFEQQSLNFGIHTILPLVKFIEQELNLKLFGDRNTVNYVEFNVDAMIRGDLKSRMEALARAVNAALITPNEARALDNRIALPGGDSLYIQGATVPLEDAGKNPSDTAIQPTPDGSSEDAPGSAQND